MGRSCGEIVLIVIVGIAALNLLFTAFGWSGLVRQGGPKSNKDPAEDLHVALENLRQELRRIHSAASANNSHRMHTIPNLQPLRAEGLSSADENIAVHKTDFPTPVLKRAGSRAPKSVVIFTMDSIGSYEKNSLSGGAAGEKACWYSVVVVAHRVEHVVGLLSQANLRCAGLWSTHFGTLARKSMC